MFVFTISIASALELLCITYVSSSLLLGINQMIRAKGLDSVMACVIIKFSYGSLFGINEIIRVNSTSLLPKACTRVGAALILIA